MTVDVGRNGHAVGDTLVVLDGSTEVYSAHGLDDYLQLLSFGYRRELQTVLVSHAVNLADVLIVDKHLRKVVTLVECKHAGSRDLGQGCYIHYRAPALVQLLHCA